MAKLPSTSDDAEERIRTIVERYAREHGVEDDLDRAVASLESTGREQSKAVIRKYRDRIEREPGVDPERLDELAERLGE